MTDDELRVRMKAYVKGWEEAGPYLEQERRERVRASITSRDLPVFDGLALGALERFPPSATSGLVEQQRIFQRWSPVRP